METAIQEYKDFADITKSAPALLKANRTSIANAVAFGQSLLKKIQDNGMSPELDKEINDYILKLKRTLTLVQDSRTPITKLMASVSKEFTSIEQALDSKRTETTWFKLQKIRNDYAKELAEKAKIEADAKQLDIDKNNEFIQLKARIEEHVNLKYNAHIFSLKEGLRSIFNDLNLKEWDQGVQLINEYSEEITLDLYRTWIIPYAPVYMTKAESDETIKSAMMPMKEKLNADLQVQVTLAKQAFITEYPAKKNELIAINEASAAEKTRLESERKQREDDQVKAIAAQKAIDDKATQEKAVAVQEEAKMANMFDAETVKADAPKRTGYEISLTSQKGYLPIINLWFESDGKSWPTDTLEKMTIGRMKKFCEVYAHKNDQKIVSPYVKYTEVYAQKAK